MPRVNDVFAFIIHDVKNLVSQLSLIIRNAERQLDQTLAEILSPVESYAGHD